MELSIEDLTNYKKRYHEIFILNSNIEYTSLVYYKTLNYDFLNFKTLLSYTILVNYLINEFKYLIDIVELHVKIKIPNNINIIETSKPIYEKLLKCKINIKNIDKRTCKKEYDTIIKYILEITSILFNSIKDLFETNEYLDIEEKELSLQKLSELHLVELYDNMFKNCYKLREPYLSYNGKEEMILKSIFKSLNCSEYKHKKDLFKDSKISINKKKDIKLMQFSTTLKSIVVLLKDIFKLHDLNINYDGVNFIFQFYNKICYVLYFSKDFLFE